MRSGVRFSSGLAAAGALAGLAWTVVVPAGCGVDSGGSRPFPQPSGDGGPPRGVATVTIDATQRHQTLVGFGAAEAFYSNYLSARSNADGLYTLLFDDLGLDLLRLGNWYQVQPSTGTTTSTPFGDNAGVAIVQKAIAAVGHPPKILLSSWSPPAYLKSNGTTRGTKGTLLQNADGTYQYAQFADWWVRSLQAYAAQGVVPDYISIQNEPDYFNSGWESCQLDPVEGTNAGYTPALNAVYAAVQASSLASKPQIIGPESSGISANGRANFPGYMSNMNFGDLAAIAHHLYNGGSGGDDPAPDGFASAMGYAADQAAAAGLPIFMTEFSPNKPTMFDTAWLIHDSLVTEGVSAYFYWALTWAPPSAGNPPTGLVTIASGNPSSSFTINDMYYAVKHFAKWTDPGWTRVDATSNDDQVKVSAFTSPDGADLTVVVLNNDVVDEAVTVDVGAFAYATSAAYRSSGATERVAQMALGDGGTITVPVGGIATITFGP
jgi:glucuronoarabinoxylan endo-1,4-beta-xylanase